MRPFFIAHIGVSIYCAALQFIEPAARAREQHLCRSLGERVRLPRGNRLDSFSKFSLSRLIHNETSRLWSCIRNLASCAAAAFPSSPSCPNAKENKFSPKVSALPKFQHANSPTRLRRRIIRALSVKNCAIALIRKRADPPGTKMQFKLSGSMALLLIMLPAKEKVIFF